MLLEHQAAGDVHGFLLDRDRRSVDFTMNGYTLHVSLDSIFGDTSESGFGMIMADGKDAFLGVGKGFRVSFTPYPASGSAGRHRRGDGREVRRRQVGSRDGGSTATRTIRARPGGSIRAPCTPKNFRFTGLSSANF